MTERRPGRYRKYWDELTSMYGNLCYYCRDELATTIDHVVPWSWDNDNDITNLVPACARCNSIASDKMFDDVEHKRQYILNRRKSKRTRRSVCTECLLPFEYRVMSPSLFLCAECYDREYDTSWSNRRVWKDWLKILRTVGTYPEAHRYAFKKYGPANTKRDKRQFVYLIIEYYTQNIFIGDGDLTLW
jgi:hypothetical protein